MVLLVDFYDVMILLGDFIMVKSYMIDWKKMVVVYWGGYY